MKIDNKFLVLTILIILFGLISCGRDESGLSDTNENCVHNWHEIEKTYASCEKEGVIVYVCVDCEETKQIVYQNALGHTEVVDAMVDATCTKTGLTEGIHCGVCNKILKAQEEVAMETHDYVSKIVEPTCNNRGYTTYTCNNCKHTYCDSYVEQLEHKEVLDSGIEATCTKTGLTEGSHCSECDSIIKQQEIIESLGHKYDDDICVVCGENYYTEGLEFVLNSDKQTYTVRRGTAIGDIVIPSMHDGIKVSCVGSFSYSDEVISVFICEGVDSIEENAFSRCSNLQSIVIPQSVDYIGSSSFSYCTSLKSITFPSSVSEMGTLILNGCSGIESIVIPCLNTSLGNAYGEGTYFVNVPESLTEIKILGGKSLPSGAFQGCIMLMNIELPNTLESIGDYAFNGCSSLTNITIPSGIITIGNNTFAGCSSLKQIILPEGLISIGRNSFIGCEGLEEIKLPSSVQIIEDQAFYNCSGLTYFVIPESLKTIGVGVFMGCSNLKVIFNDSKTRLPDYSNIKIYSKYTWKYVDGVPTPI